MLVTISNWDISHFILKKVNNQEQVLMMTIIFYVNNLAFLFKKRAIKYNKVKPIYMLLIKRTIQDRC